MTSNGALWTYLQALGAVILLIVILTGVFIRAVPPESTDQFGEIEFVRSGSFWWIAMKFVCVCGLLVVSAAFLYQAMLTEGGVTDVMAVVGMPSVLLLIWWITGGTTGLPSAIFWMSGTGAALVSVGLAGSRRHQHSG